MLRGRGRELDLVGRLLGDVRGGGQRALIVDGEAGIGKTRLVAEAVSVSEGTGFRTFAGAAEPAERGRPFAAVSRLLGVAGSSGDPLAGEIGELLASMEYPGADRRWADPGAVGYRVTDAVVELIERNADAGPVLLVLDDLHWADHPSSELLDSIHRRLADLPIALLVTVRTGENPMHVNELLGRLAAGSRTLSLAPLTEDAVAALATDLTGARVGARLRGQLAKADGNPFFVTELLRALDDEGLLTVEAGVIESRASSVPIGLVHTVLRRLRLLPAETLELLRFASILGQSFSVADLAKVTGRSTVELARRLAPALHTHTLRESGEQLAFGHGLTWEVVYHELPAAVRRAVHREAATVLAEAGVPAVRVVRHFALGAEFGDTEAVSWLRKAARGVAPGSPATAAELFGKALELAGPGHRNGIVAELAPLLVVIGEVAQAKELTEEALARGVDPGIEARLRAGLIHVLIRRGRVGDARVQAIKLLELLPLDARDLVCGIAGFVLVTAGDADQAEEMALRALAASEAAGHELVTATALMTLTWTYGAHGRVQDAVSVGRRAVAATEHSTATMSGLLFPHCPLGAALLQADRFTEAERAFRDGLARAERTAAPGTLVYHQSGLAAKKFLCGDWDGALSDAEVALDVAGKTGTSWMLLPSAVIARIAVARDDLSTAEAVVDKALRAPEAGHTTMTLDWLHWARAVLLHAAGAADQAVAAAERAWRTVPTMRDVIGNRIAPVDCVRIALAAGNRALAEEIADELSRMAGRTAMASLRATALHCRGLVAGDFEALTDALALLRNTARRYQWAMLNEDAAVGVGPADRSTAQARFRAALTGYRELAATRDVARVSAAMRASGLRPGGATRVGDGALTHTERTVAGLVAEGLSNPQIARRLYISRHTAETHMKHIFAKLGLSSRTELAALVAKGQLPG